MSAVARIPEPEAGALSADVTVIGETAYVTVIPLDEQGELPDGIEAQSEVVIDALAAELSRVGAGLGDVAHLTIYLRDLGQNRPVFNEVYARRFGATVPVRCAVGVAELARPAMLVELTAIAAVPLS
ncbi:RidA family protein [Leucobacter rhizosphaerae]|uniref:RidA family protein n=1 Tax=Leucobacter rhizosphaerae TaxID=2932245 RepID=A0ABY4FZQ2_9MICO|nr:RidA family protein [Leucobacter rhizosphaerae]UOQ61800.1 RidA family protein [Leucobacter rhizosphaerae]